MSATYGSTRWALAFEIAGALFLWSWYDVPVDPSGPNGLASPILILLIACVPLGLVLAALGARFAHRSPATGALSWAGAFVFGIWLGGWTSLLGTSAGLLDCEPPGCRSAWGPRVLTFVTAAVVVFACARAEAALRKRWSSAPS